MASRSFVTLTGGNGCCLAPGFVDRDCLRCECSNSQKKQTHSCCLMACWYRLLRLCRIRCNRSSSVSSRASTVMNSGWLAVSIDDLVVVGLVVASQQLLGDGSWRMASKKRCFLSWAALCSTNAFEEVFSKFIGLNCLLIPSPAANRSNKL